MSKWMGWKRSFTSERNKQLCTVMLVLTKRSALPICLIRMDLGCGRSNSTWRRSRALIGRRAWESNFRLPASEVNRMPFAFWHEREKRAKLQPWKVHSAQWGKCRSVWWESESPKSCIDQAVSYGFLCRRALSRAHSLFHISHRLHLYISISSNFPEISGSGSQMWRNSFHGREGTAKNVMTGWRCKVPIRITSRANRTNYYVKWIWLVWVKNKSFQNQTVKAE